MNTAEPTEFVFDEIAEAAVAKVIARYPAGKQASAVMALLDIVQRQMGRQTGSAWVPRVAMDVVAKRLGMAPVRVYEVATFYLMYNTKPVGKYHLQVCTTTPCWLRGSDEIVAACKKAGGVKDFGHTSEDGLFTMTEVECLGACVNAPILQINDDYYEDLDGEKTEALLHKLKAGEPLPPAGSVIGRQASAPVSNQTTLLQDGTPGGVTQMLNDADQDLSKSLRAAGLEAARREGARRLGRHRRYSRPRAGCDHRGDEDLRHARPWRRRFPDRHEMVVHAQAERRPPVLSRGECR